MKKEPPKPLTSQQVAELNSLAALSDDMIDTSDAPEVLDWSLAKRGLFYRPIKQQLTLRLDADVIAWFKAQASSDQGYQTRINRALREYALSMQQSGRTNNAVTKHDAKRLDARTRDRDREIRKKRNDTLVRTLREEYGDQFAKGYRSDAKLGTVLKREGLETLNDLLKGRRSELAGRRRG